MFKKKCPKCGYIGSVYDFSPSIEIGPGDFRIFHTYNQMNGPLYCNQCKRKYLLKIAEIKNLTEEQKNFLRKKIEEEKEKFSLKKIK